MMRKKHRYPESSLFGKKHAFWQSIAISFLINFILILGMLFGHRHGYWGGQEVDWVIYCKFFGWHFCCNVVLFYLLSIFNFHVIRSRIKSDGIPWWTTLGTIFICLLVSPLLAQIQWYALGGERGLAEGAFVVFNLVKDMILGLVVVLVIRNTFSNFKREQAIIANQKLREENIRVRFDALKNQLDPHFLFNSLNTLSGLIGIDDDKARRYIDDLSKVFRYTLQNRRILSLSEELAFVESYVALLQIRFGENLQVDYDIDPNCRSLSIMPISIQLLVENAVKHNAISNRTPLRIDIHTTPQRSIVVSNRINPKAEKSPGGGVGLANLADRYAMLFHQAITITYTDGAFSVEIPLIEETDKKLNI